MATWRLVRAAERAGVERFVFFSVLGASTRSRSRLLRAKATAERALAESTLPHTIFAPSIVYAPGDQYLTLLRRMSLLPVMPIPGSGRAPFQPMWAEDVADCVMAALPGGVAAEAALGARYELAGPGDAHPPPDRPDGAALARAGAARSSGFRDGVVRRGLNLMELLAGPTAFATWDEAELMDIALLSARGTADAEALGVRAEADGARCSAPAERRVPCRGDARLPAAPGAGGARCRRARDRAPRSVRSSMRSVPSTPPRSRSSVTCETIEGLATAVGPLADSVDRLTATMSQLVALLGPLAGAERDVQRLERRFGFRRHRDPSRRRPRTDRSGFGCVTAQARRADHGAAASICAASASSGPSPSVAADELDRARQAVLALAQRQRDGRAGR